MGAMDELDFYRSLKGHSKVAAPQWVSDTLSRTKGFLGNHKNELIGGALGAALVGGTQYASSRPKKDTGRSREQELAEELIAVRQAAALARAQSGRETSFNEGLGDIGARSYGELADHYSKHPGKGALSVMPIGAALGLLAARTLTKKRG